VVPGVRRPRSADVDDPSAVHEHRRRAAHRGADEGGRGGEGQHAVSLAHEVRAPAPYFADADSWGTRLLVGAERVVALTIWLSASSVLLAAVSCRPGSE